MWPFKSKKPNLPTKGDLQVDLARMDFAADEVALLFEVPDENDSRYWIVDDPSVLTSLSDGSIPVTPPNFFANVNKIPNAAPDLPILVRVLQDREWIASYDFSAPPDFSFLYHAEQFLTALGPQARSVVWHEAYLRGRTEIAALQKRLWQEDNLFALAELPDTTEMQHDYTHCFVLKFPPTDAPPDQHASVVKPIGALMEKAFPNASDLYNLGPVRFAKTDQSTGIAIRASGALNATQVKQVRGPKQSLFTPEALVFCDQAFYDHAARNIRDLMPATSLLSETYQTELARLVQAAKNSGKLVTNDGVPQLTDGDYWLAPSAFNYRPHDFPFRYFEWPA